MSSPPQVIELTQEEGDRLHKLWSLLTRRRTPSQTLELIQEEGERLHILWSLLKKKATAFTYSGAFSRRRRTPPPPLAVR